MVVSRHVDDTKSDWDQIKKWSFNAGAVAKILSEVEHEFVMSCGHLCTTQ